MDRKLWQLIYHVVMSLDDANSSPSWTTHSDRVIVMIELWATAHEQSILWATRPQHWRWPELMPAALPHQSTVSRRQRSASVIALRAAFYGRLRQVVAVGWLQEIDGRGLTINGFSKDPDARRGYAGKTIAKGYKFHGIWDLGVVPAAWELHPMNRAEQKVAVSLVRQLPEESTGYLLGDANYDSNPLHKVTSARALPLHLVAPAQKKKAKGLGHRRHEPSRLRALHLLNKPFGEALYARRTDVERRLGHLATSPVGLDRLPWHVRRLTRVRRFVELKLILEGCYRWQQTQELTPLTPNLYSGRQAA
jgi:hypothetical protein